MQANGIASAVFFSCLLIVASVWDIRKKIIPDTICLAIAAMGLLTFHPTKLLGVLLGIPLLIAALVKEGGMGGGDMEPSPYEGLVQIKYKPYKTLKQRWKQGAPDYHRVLIFESLADEITRQIYVRAK